MPQRPKGISRGPRNSSACQHLEAASHLLEVQLKRYGMFPDNAWSTRGAARGPCGQRRGPSVYATTRITWAVGLCQNPIDRRIVGALPASGGQALSAPTADLSER
jgi:hypothetical protein